MTILKCKMCGGDIVLTGESYGVCEHCGSEVTLPKIDDDKRADMFNRGNYFRQKGGFDMAYSAYEHIVAEDKTDAEAHWCLMLCRYGIEYVEDKRTGEYKPTCSRMSNEPILDDIDYLAALEYSDEYTKDIYRREAQKIAEIQSRYLEISRNEAPYDVFICFKAENENGERTEGSVVAQEIFERLEREGVRSFFSKITLHEKAGEEYEPYIFAALNSAKVFLVVADKPEHLQARWVKNEWMRYLSVMDRDKTKKMIPVCVGISPYDLPDEMPGKIQAVEWNKIGAEQDLIRGILKITGKLDQRTVAPAAPVRSGINVENKLKAVLRDLEDRDYKSAIKTANTILDDYPENGMAHFYLLLANNNVKALKDLSYEENWQNDSRFKRALKYGDEKTKRELEDFLTYCKNIRKYNKGMLELEEKRYSEAHKIFASLGDFQDSATLAQQAKDTLEGIQIRDRALSRFNNEVGDKYTYISRKLKENIPDEVSKYEKLKAKSEYKSYYDKSDRIKFIVCLVVMFLCTISWSIYDSGGKSVLWGIAFTVLLYHWFIMDFGLLKCGAMVVGFSVLPTVLYSISDTFLGGFGGSLLFKIVSLVIIAWFARQIYLMFNAKASKKLAAEMYQNTISPEIEKIRKELREKYKEELGDQKAFSVTEALKYNYIN